MIARQAVRPEEFLIDDGGVVAARIDALVGGGRLRVIVHQPHAGADRVVAVAAGAQREVDALRRPDVERVAGDARVLRHRDSRRDG